MRRLLFAVREWRSAATFSLPRTEQSVIASLLDAAAHPDALTTAVQAYQEEQNATGGGDAAGLRRERNALEGALKQVEREEAAAVQAQIAGIAARRKDLEGRRGTIARLLTGPGKGERRKTKTAGDGLAGEALKDIARVVCRPHGADVFFLPGLGAAQIAASLDGAETCNSTLTELMQ